LPKDSDLYWDPYDNDADVHAQEIWKRMRDEAPLYRNEKLDFYALTRFDDVLAVMLDTETFSSAHATTLELMTAEPHKTPFILWMDPPLHTHLRSLVNRAFTPRAIGALESTITRVCTETLDQFVGTDGFDFVDQFAALLPPKVILALLGFPEGGADQWRRAIDEMFHEMGATGADTAQGLAEPPSTVVGSGRDPKEVLDESTGFGSTVFGLLPRLIEERRRSPEDDLISTLVSAQIDEDGTRRSISEAELYAFIQILAIAGTETVARLLSWSAVLLARHPDQRELLVSDPALIPNAVEELLRYEAPSPVNARYVTRDVEFHGTTVPTGSKLILLNGSANRDERQFENPDAFDVRRKILRHTSFGHGAHFCVGAALARLEARIALRETLARFPTWQVDESALQWVHTSTVRGYANVPITLPA
jgi:cytochrome P450